jgi:non-ribosomal peptide synthetase component E (peptide arylation enzyme)
MGLPAHLAGFRGAGLWGGRTIADLARMRAQTEPDAVVFLNDPAKPTYASLLSDAEAMATALEDLGIVSGDVISFQTPNWFEAAVINLAAAIGGFVINPIVPIYRDTEVRQMLADGGAKVFFVCAKFRNFDYLSMAGRIRAELPALAHVVKVRGEGEGGLTY